MTVVSMSYLLESGVHFGHQTKRWNPKMKEYIHTARDGIYIIDLQKTAKKIEEAYNFLADVTEKGGKVIFVGTRKQASQAIKDEATRANSFYICERWLGGTLTNYKTIRKRIKRLEDIEKMEQDGTFERLPKKEVVGIKKEYDKLNLILEGIRDMRKLPQAMFVVDPSKEEIAIREAKKLNIPVIGIVDTNCDPDMVDYVIPANDDAIRSVKLITAIMANAINSKTDGEIIDFGQIDDPSDDAGEIMKKAVETVNKKPARRVNDYDTKRRVRTVKYTKNDEISKEKPVRKETVKKEEPKETVTEQKPEVTQKVEKPKASQKTEKPVKKETKTDKKEAVKETVDLSSKTVAELKELAKEKKIKGYSTMKKADLIKALS